jgi:hypothetical protein
MEVACTALSCMLLMTSHFVSPIAGGQQTATKLVQQDNVMTATASSDTKGDACSSSIDKAYNLCMIGGFFNITSVNCDCTQRNIRGAPDWECVGTATCKK